ncbi:hypothetical protein [Saccharopolyspora phatthalungensis]|uniref:EfeO-type cupredoxin-like domain-containing protein n=1 Tax=Saccharopolyspora phatthalungensis TaxID=664693 RepID=A0A840QIH5_9PSEU|nr:hypothetical protein [Saccharopolyspora phatthalungensis]MBB5158529.1 hypothetical protein [Saccharopolyspora phatthalungensis]
MLIKVKENWVLRRKSGRAGRTLLGVLLGVFALVAALCAGASAAVASSPAPPGPAFDGGPGVVTVRMVEFRLLQPDSLPPGLYTFRAINAGSAPHALQIAGPGVSARTPVVQPGEAADLTVTLGPGLYDFWCPVGDHREMGMQLDVNVG